MCLSMNNNFKLLRIIRSLDPAGGGPIEGLIQLTPYLTKRGISTTVATLDSPSRQWYSHLPFDLLPLGPVLGPYGYRPDLVSRLTNLANSFDAVIIDGLWQYHAFAAWRALHHVSVPYYVFVHGMLDPWFKYQYPLKHLKKTIYWPLSEYRLLRDASGVLFTTTTERDLARLSFNHYTVKEYVVGYGAASPLPITSSDIDTYFATYPTLQGKDVYLFLGRIHPKKGVDLLIRAFAATARHDPRRHLVLAGPVQPHYQSLLRSLLRKLSIESQATWTGPLSGSMKWSAFSTAQLFCLPSHQENFGVAVAEALSVGLPVCISHAVNISDTVERFGAGIVHIDTLDSTIDGLLRWAAMDHASRDLMSRSAKHLFSSQFDWEHVSERLAELLIRGSTSVKSPIIPQS
jgi:glycosyltransferase involved in cell wall biosynthesis